MHFIHSRPTQLDSSTTAAFSNHPLHTHRHAQQAPLPHTNCYPHFIYCSEIYVSSFFCCCCCCCSVVLLLLLLVQSTQQQRQRRQSLISCIHPQPNNHKRKRTNDFLQLFQVGVVGSVQLFTCRKRFWQSGTTPPTPPPSLH